MGAYREIENIPQCWIDKVINCKPHRPTEYHIKNILELADKLLTL